MAKTDPMDMILMLGVLYFAYILFTGKGGAAGTGGNTKEKCPPRGQTYYHNELNPLPTCDDGYEASFVSLTNPFETKCTWKGQCPSDTGSSGGNAGTPNCADQGSKCTSPNNICYYNVKSCGFDCQPCSKGTCQMANGVATCK